MFLGIILLAGVFVSPNFAEAQIPPVVSGEIKRVPYNAFVSTAYNFSITPPSGWTIDDRVSGDVIKTIVDFTSSSKHGDGFVIGYDEFPISDMNIFSNMPLGEIADFFIEPYDTGIAYKERDVWIREDSNAYVIYLEYTQFDRLAEKTGYNEIVIYVMKNGDVYYLSFVSVIIDSSSSIANKFHQSLNTFHVGPVIKEQKPIPKPIPKPEPSGGCLIATATYGSELAPQVQLLRELRDNSLLNTESGTLFMNTFNDVYYSFSPSIADYERENPFFKEIVKVAITPLISSLSLLHYVDLNSEEQILGYGISLIILNLGMYIGIPIVAIIGIRNRCR